jgi:hypothetical protein
MPVTRSTGSGAATSGGISFQHRVGAYYGALILAGEVRVPGLGTDVAATQLWLETDEPLDDVKIVDALGVSLLIQAKRTLDAGVGAKTEFAKVCDQLVRAHRHGAADSRFSIVVGRETGHPIATRLAAVLHRARAQPPAAAPRHLAPSKDEKRMYDKLLAHLRRAARNHGQSADAAELRAILRRTEVRVLDVEPGGKSEHCAIRALERDVVLDPGQASAAWSALLEASAELARTRSHADRAGLQEVLRRKRIALREPPDLRPEIAALRQRSAESLKMLASRSAIALKGDAQLKIDREAARALAELASRGSLAVVGDAGAGKSACTHEAFHQLHADGAEVIVIAAELIEAHSDVALGRELRIVRDEGIACLGLLELVGVRVHERDADRLLVEVEVLLPQSAVARAHLTSTFMAATSRAARRGRGRTRAVASAARPPSRAPGATAASVETNVSCSRSEEE